MNLKIEKTKAIEILEEAQVQLKDEIKTAKVKQKEQQKELDTIKKACIKEAKNLVVVGEFNVAIPYRSDREAKKACICVSTRLDFSKLSIPTILKDVEDYEQLLRKLEQKLSEITKLYKMIKISTGDTVSSKVASEISNYV